MGYVNQLVVVIVVIARAELCVAMNKVKNFSLSFYERFLSHISWYVWFESIIFRGTMWFYC